MSMEQFEIAVAAMPKLEQQHMNFMNAISKLENFRKVAGLDFMVIGDELECTTLGVPMTVPHSLFVRDGNLAGIEYKFTAHVWGEPLHLWQMYLLPSRSLSTDSAGQNKICDFDNSSLSEHIAPLIAAALLKSSIFVPRA